MGERLDMEPWWFKDGVVTINRRRKELGLPKVPDISITLETNPPPVMKEGVVEFHQRQLDIKPGDIIDINGERYQVTKIENEQSMTVKQVADLATASTPQADFNGELVPELVDVGTIEEEAGWTRS